MSEENRILTLSDWSDFSYYTYGYSIYFYGLSTQLYSDWEYSSMGCDDYGGHSSKIDDYDEIHILIPEGVTIIEDRAFYHAPSELKNKITYVSIPNTCSRIEGYAFSGCNGLNSIVIPSSVTDIYNGAFYYCENLNTIYCEAETKPDGWYSDWNYSCNAEVVWGYKAQNTVTFETNGGSAVESQVVDNGAQASVPTSSKEGYTLVGWYTDEALTNEYDFATAVTEDITLYAKWDVKTYDVTFNVNGGSAVTKQTINHNEKVSKPTDPTKDGYTFGGWYTDVECTQAYDFNSNVTEDLSLYAKWTEVVAEPEPETPVEDNEQETPVTEENDDNKDKVNVAAIAGGIGGGVAGIAVIGTIIGFVINKRKIK